MDWKSPIEVYWGEADTKVEDDVVKVVQHYDINVDKNELKKALAFSKDQYQKGWNDAKMFFGRKFEEGKAYGRQEILTRLRMFLEDYGDKYNEEDEDDD